MTPNPTDLPSPRVFEALQYEGCYPKDGGMSQPGQYHHDGPFVLKSEYDDLLLAYKDLLQKRNELLAREVNAVNSGSPWPYPGDGYVSSNEATL